MFLRKSLVRVGDAAGRHAHATGLKEMDHGAMAGMEHGMKHDDPNNVLVELGKTAGLTCTFTKASNLEFACNIPAHYQAGMVGKLTVSQ